MEELVEKGLVKSIGVSNFTRSQLTELLQKAKIKPVCNQIEVSPLLSQTDLFEFCEKNGIKIVAYSPLARGSSLLLENPKLLEISRQLGGDVTTAQIVIKWITQKGKKKNT